MVDNTDPGQLVLLSEDPVVPLTRSVAGQFAGKQLVAGEVFQWVMNETVYLNKHTRAALKALEDARALDVLPVKASGEKRRGRTFPDDAILRFTGPRTC